MSVLLTVIWYYGTYVSIVNSDMVLMSALLTVIWYLCQYC